MIKIWLDDVRDPPDESWIVARTEGEAISLIRRFCAHDVTISLDHDLGFGDCGSGYGVARRIERDAFFCVGRRIDW